MRRSTKYLTAHLRIRQTLEKVLRLNLESFENIQNLVSRDCGLVGGFLRLRTVVVANCLWLDLLDL